MGERAARKLAVSRREKPPGLGRWDRGRAAQGKRSPLLNMEAVKPIMLNRDETLAGVHGTLQSGPLAHPPTLFLCLFFQIIPFLPNESSHVGE